MEINLAKNMKTECLNLYKRRDSLSGLRHVPRRPTIHSLELMRLPREAIGMGGLHHRTQVLLEHKGCTPMSDVVHWVLITRLTAPMLAFTDFFTSLTPERMEAAAAAAAGASCSLAFSRCSEACPGHLREIFGRPA